jgi:hypothetical protein
VERLPDSAQGDLERGAGRLGVAGAQQHRGDQHPVAEDGRAQDPQPEEELGRLPAAPGEQQQPGAHQRGHRDERQGAQ